MNILNFNQQTQTQETNLIFYAIEMIYNLAIETQTLEKVRSVFIVLYHCFSFSLCLITELQLAFNYPLFS